MCYNGLMANLKANRLSVTNIREYERLRRLKPEWSALRHKYGLKQNYGMTPEEYSALLERQAGRCAICRKPPQTRRLAVDHDHKTGHIRGLLCPRCNRCIGLFQDRLDLLQRAASYLESNT